MDTVAESERKEKSPRASTRFSLIVENERADADETIEPVSTDRILRRERGPINNFSLFSLTRAGRAAMFG